MELRSRWCESLLRSALRAMPVVVVTGARQTGKTTLVRHTRGLSKRRFFTLDQFDILEQAERDPDSLLAELPVTIDEIQRAPKLLLAIKRKVDEFREPGAILVTGSANLALFDQVNETLAGRAYYLELPPFCPAEWQGLAAKELGLDALFAADFESGQWPATPGDWRPWCTLGGYPSVLAQDDGDARDLWFAGYVQTYLERDLRQLSNVSSLTDFQRVMKLAAHRVSRLVNQSDLSRDSGVPQPTVHRYLNLLETGYQIARLANHQRNPNKSLTKVRKLQWTDTGLVAWLSGAAPEGITERPDSGFLLEQLVFQSLQSWRVLAPRRRVHYWREGTHEVDFVLEQNGAIVGLEVKAARQISTGDLRGVRAFQQAFKKGKVVPRAVVLHGGTEARFLGDNAWALPFGTFAPPRST